MNGFVEECRREWKRLRVPDPVADEMAADLAADLQEADAEGASAEDVLGTSAFDPRSFATAWAVERGVIPRPLPSGRELPWRWRISAGIGVSALAAIIGAVLVISASPSTSERVPLAAPDGQPRAVLIVTPDRARLSPVPPVWSVDVDDNGALLDTRTVGSALLLAGLAGVVFLTMLSLWVGRTVASRSAPPMA